MLNDLLALALGPYTEKRKAAQATEAAKRGKEIVSIESIAQKRRTRK